MNGILIENTRMENSQKQKYKVTIFSQRSALCTKGAWGGLFFKNLWSHCDHKISHLLQELLSILWSFQDQIRSKNVQWLV